VESNDPLGFLLFLLRASGADGNQLPPGFLPPVKGQVASLSYIRGVA